MSKVSVSAVLDFLSVFKTRKELEEEFKLSNTESFHLINWMKKGNFIESIQVSVENKTNRSWLYRKKG